MPLPTVPEDYDERLRQLRRRRRLHLTQGALALRLGAAGKAVVYQWESRKRTPSPVLWQRILGLKGRTAASEVHTAPSVRTDSTSLRLARYNLCPRHGFDPWDTSRPV